MTTADLLTALTARGVRLSIGAAGKLVVDAPAGALVGADWTALADHKAGILAHLDARALDAVRRLWPILHGTVSISPGLVVLDLSQASNDPGIDADAAALRQALVTVGRLPSWPKDGAGLERAVARLMDAVVLIKDDHGGLMPA